MSARRFSDRLTPERAVRPRKDRGTADAPARPRSRTAAQVDELGILLYRLLAVGALALLLVGIFFVSFGPSEPFAYRALSLCILGVLPAAAIVIVASALRALCRTISNAFDPAERAVVGWAARLYRVLVELTAWLRSWGARLRSSCSSIRAGGRLLSARPVAVAPNIPRRTRPTFDID